VNVVVIASTAGSVLAALLTNPYFRTRIRHVVADRQCGAVDVARSFGVDTTIHKTRDGREFSDFLQATWQADPPDLFFSFYTRLFHGEFLRFADGKLVNVHPSILPACPGLDGFGDTLKASSRFVGATLHFVNAGMDTGAPIIQAAAPYDPTRSTAENRHRVFIQQCKMVLQVIKYVQERRLSLCEERVVIDGVRYETGEFSPNLDDDLDWCRGALAADHTPRLN
jgi:phosphoribosylglycinamide formyltransferase-1